MANEGLQEVLHAAARGENIACFMLNNGVFGETGGHLTVTTTVGQRTKNTLDGRDPRQHGHPMRIAELIAGIDGVGYVARGAVNDAGNVARTKRMIVDAFAAQQQRPRVVLRRDPHHVPDRLVRPHRRGSRLPGRDHCRHPSGRRPPIGTPRRCRVSEPLRRRRPLSGVVEQRSRGSRRSTGRNRRSHRGAGRDLRGARRATAAPRRTSLGRGPWAGDRAEWRTTSTPSAGSTAASRSTCRSTWPGSRRGSDGSRDSARAWVSSNRPGSTTREFGSRAQPARTPRPSPSS